MSGGAYSYLIRSFTLALLRAWARNKGSLDNSLDRSESGKAIRCDMQPATLFLTDLHPASRIVHRVPVSELPFDTVDVWIVGLPYHLSRIHPSVPVFEHHFVLVRHRL